MDRFHVLLLFVTLHSTSCLLGCIRPNMVLPFKLFLTVKLRTRPLESVWKLSSTTAWKNSSSLSIPFNVIIGRCPDSKFQVELNDYNFCYFFCKILEWFQFLLGIASSQYPTFRKRSGLFQVVEILCHAKIHWRLAALPSFR